MTATLDITDTVWKPKHFDPKRIKEKVGPDKPIVLTQNHLNAFISAAAAANGILKALLKEYYE